MARTHLAWTNHSLAVLPEYNVAPLSVGGRDHTVQSTSSNLHRPGQSRGLRGFPNTTKGLPGGLMKMKRRISILVGLVLLGLVLCGAAGAQEPLPQPAESSERMFFPRATFYGYAQFDLAPPHNEIDPNP